MRRVVALAAMSAALSATPAVAQQRADAKEEAWPSRNIRLIVPFSPGSGPDAVGRRLGQGITERTGRIVVVDNRPGVSGLLGTHEVARATPDGHTVGLLSMTMAVSQGMLAKPPVDIARDVEPVIQLFRQYTIVIVRPDSPLRTAKDLVDLLKQKPGAYTFASGGSGTPAHLAGELFVRSVGARATHVPYKAIALAITDIVRGDVLFACSVMTNVATLIQGGRLKALGVVGPKRVSAFPDVPAFPELGLPDPEVSSWSGIMAPKGTPLPVRRRMLALFTGIVDDAGHAKAFEMLGLEPAKQDIDTFGATIRSEVARWGKFVREADLRMD
jgi:tripartite-type tricarboxylate transporter receptor subunit TctC